MDMTFVFIYMKLRLVLLVHFSVQFCLLHADFGSIFRRRQLFLKIHNLFDLNQEPTVYLGQAEDIFNRESSP